MSETSETREATAPPAPPAPATPPPVHGEKLDRAVLATAGVVVLGALMSILDVTVVNVAINTLARDFDTSLTTIQWVATGYTLALATVIPLTAWGAERFGTTRLYMISIALFVLGSALAGTAWDAASLIGFRVLQGLGGGMIMPLGMTILTRAAGPHRIGRLMAVIGIPMLLGPVLGPVLGGWLVDDYSWRWIFFINLPIGLLALVLAARILPRDTPGGRARLDRVGLLLLSPGLALLIYGLAESGANGGFGHVQVILPAVVGALLVAGFVWHALRTPHPLVDLRLYRNRVFAASSGTLMLVVIAVFGGMLLMPLYLQLVRGESPLDTGLLIAPQGLGAMLAMPIAGRLADRTGIGRFVPIGLALVAGSYTWLSVQLAADTPYWHLSIALFVTGVGMGFTMMPTMTGALQTMPRASIAGASTALNITQQVAASFGTAVLSVVLATTMTGRLGGAAAGGSIGDLAALPQDVFARIQPALAESFGHTFRIAAVFVALAFVVALVLLPKRRPAAPVE